MDLRPWLLHVMPSAFNMRNVKSASARNALLSAAAACLSKPETQVLKLRFFVNREAMVWNSPGRQSGGTARNERQVPEGRQDDPDTISVVPPGLWGRLLLLNHGLASMAVTCHAFGIQYAQCQKRQRTKCFAVGSSGMPFQTRSASEGRIPAQTRSASEGRASLSKVRRHKCAMATETEE